MKRFFLTSFLLLIPFILTSGDTPQVYRQFDFHYALAREDLETVRDLLEDGADPNSIPSDILEEETGEEPFFMYTSVIDKAPLTIALRERNSEMIDLLLRNGADISAHRDILKTAMEREFFDLTLGGLKSLAQSGEGTLPEEYLGGIILW